MQLIFVQVIEVLLQVSFASNSISNSSSGALILVGNDGVMTEYSLFVTLSTYSGATGVTSSVAQPRSNPDEAMIQCTLKPIVQWTLQRLFLRTYPGNSRLLKFVVLNYRFEPFMSILLMSRQQFLRRMSASFFQHQLSKPSFTSEIKVKLLILPKST